MDFEALESFVVFAEHLNFTHAAETLHISQPALHTKIRKLQERLNVPLYRRLGRRLELTYEGVELLRFGREMVGRTQAFVESLKTGGHHQPLVFAAGEGSYLYLLGEAIQRFSQESEAPLRLLTRNREASMEAVNSGEAHIGFAPLETVDGHFVCEQVARVPQMLVVQEGHPLAGRESLDLRDLEGLRLVVPPPNRPHRQALARALLSEGVSWEVGVEATGWTLILHFVRLGLGAAVVNASCHLPTGLVSCALPQLPAIHYFLFHRGSHASKETLSHFQRVVRESIRADFQVSSSIAR